MTERGYLLDTDWASYWIRGRPARVGEVIRGLPPDRLHLSMLSLAELYAGASYSARPEQLLSAIETFREAVKLITIDPAVCRRYGALYADLRRSGQLIGDIDILIAATCLEFHLTLLTNNRQHFDRIPNLDIIPAR